MLKTYLGTVLKKKRLTQRFFADEIGVDPAQLNRYIRGKAVPRLDMAFKMAYLLRTTVDELFPEYQNHPKVAVNDGGGELVDG